MKLVQIHFHFEFEEQIEGILDDSQIEHYARYSMVEGRNCQGKHHGTKVFPGSMTVMQIMVTGEQVEDLLKRLKAFRDQEKTHQHLEVYVLPIERHL